MKVHKIKILLAAAAIICGCNPDRPLSPPSLATPNAAPSYAVDRFSSDPTMPQTLDQIFLEYGRKVPGFAGLYYDEQGNRTIALKDVRMADQARAALARAFDRSPSGRGPARGPITITRATYSFAELAGWRRQLGAEAFALSYVTSTDVDEFRNRVVIGTLPGSPRGEIMSMASRFGIPSEAVMVDQECVEPMGGPAGNDNGLSMFGAFRSPYGGDPCSSPGDGGGIDGDTAGVGDPSETHSSSDLTLHSRFRPVPGGVRISSDGGTCSVGFNTYLSRLDTTDPGRTGLYDLGQYLVTNAHCTARLGRWDGGYFVQPRLEPGADLGYEWRETQWEGTTQYMDCVPSFLLCSVADAALIKYSGASPQGGRIARTVGTCQNTACPTSIDPFSPTFRIADSVQNVFAGTQVHKIGSTTGWTSGTVFETCKNFRIELRGVLTPYTLLCQTSFNASVQGSDSGAPVFIMKGGSDVSLAGLVWGGGSGRTRFSDFVYVGYVLTKQDRAVHCPGDRSCWLSLSASK